MAAVLPASARRTNNGRFCRAKAFIRNDNAANRLKASCSTLVKQENEKNVRDPEVCNGFPLRGRRVVELNVLAKALDGGCEACGAALRLSDCIKETVSGIRSLLYISWSNSECGDTNVYRTNKTHRSTGTTRGRPIFDVNTKLAADVVHAKRPLGSSLYSIKTQNKSLTDMMIQYFQRCFGYALKQNKDGEEGVQNGLKSIVPHAYGDHSSCGNWCGFLKNPASYKHRGLPRGKDLTDKSLRQSLEKIVEVSRVLILRKTGKEILSLKEKQKTREYKKKRIEKKEKRLKKTTQLENREGQQYSSGMGFEGHDDAQKIPAPPAASKIERVSLTKDYNQIIFELETSGRGNDAEILQIAATDGKDEFSIYIKPCNVISPEASAVNKLTFQRGILFNDGKPITDAVAINVALKTFIEWLKSRTCILVAHNCESFDARFLVQAAEKNGVMEDLVETVSGFTDSLSAFMELLLVRKSHRQVNLVQDLLYKSYEVHNALADVQTLFQLVNKFVNVKLLQCSSQNELQSFMGGILSEAPKGKETSGSYPAAIS
ncbi:hypothetical protein AWC38_SpisGene21851 [Stylophora pistillata]|uniref:Exonuclease domain-containing protein n=1 Tax=Stylophora pistillata TaxID=50429 RepID=A0A2B4RB30_STYPI|nr:hypothetical protein AWC38_SpisGene21851 [Stylophora pistillata]